MAQSAKTERLEGANMAIVEENLSRLTDKDRAALIDALVSPPPPNKALRRAYREYCAKFN